MNNDLNKQATIAAIERINAVEGFDPSVLAVDYSDLSSNETRRRLPVMSQMAWFLLLPSIHLFCSVPMTRYYTMSVSSSYTWSLQLTAQDW